MLYWCENSVVGFALKHKYGKKISFEISGVCMLFTSFFSSYYYYCFQLVYRTCIIRATKMFSCYIIQHKRSISCC